MLRFVATIAIVGLSSFAAAPAVAQPVTSAAAVKPLFCAHGSIEWIPASPPPGFESQFAVAVVEIDSPKAIERAAITRFTLFDRAGNATAMKRVVKVETFDEPRVAGEGEAAYYLNGADGSRSKPWDGTLPVGKTRLRVRVALAGTPSDLVVRYALDAGPYDVQGPCDIEWPT